MVFAAVLIYTSTFSAVSLLESLQVAKSYLYIYHLNGLLKKSFSWKKRTYDVNIHSLWVKVDCSFKMFVKNNQGEYNHIHREH